MSTVPLNFVPPPLQQIQLPVPFSNHNSILHHAAASYNHLLPLHDSAPVTSSESPLTRRPSKNHVPSACVNCKKAHLACDVERPCRRCVMLSRTDTCVDTQHKKRGRPKIREKKSEISQNSSKLHKFMPPNSNSDTWARRPHHSLNHNNNNHLQSSMTSSSTLSTAQHSDPSTSSISQLNPTLPHHTFQSSFVLTATPRQREFDRPRIVTIYLSTEVACARVSDEVLDLCGYHPQELAHRSLYDFVHPSDHDILARLHRGLIDHALDMSRRQYHRSPQMHLNSLPPAERTTSDAFYSTPPTMLSMPAHGSQTFSDVIRVRKRDGELESFEAKLYFGGGLDADLHNTMTWPHLYIVATLTRRSSQVSLSITTINTAATVSTDQTLQESTALSPIPPHTQSMANTDSPDFPFQTNMFHSLPAPSTSASLYSSPLSIQYYAQLAAEPVSSASSGSFDDGHTRNSSVTARKDHESRDVIRSTPLVRFGGAGESHETKRMSVNSLLC